MALCKAVMSVKSTLDNPGPLCAVVAAGTVLPPLPNRNEIPPSTHVGVPPVLCRTCPLVPIGRRAKFLAPAAYIMSPPPVVTKPTASSRVVFMVVLLFTTTRREGAGGRG